MAVLTPRGDVRIFGWQFYNEREGYEDIWVAVLPTGREDMRIFWWQFYQLGEDMRIFGW